MNNIYPTIATTVTSVYTDKTIIICIDETDIYDTVVADRVCIEVTPVGMGVFDPQNDNVYNVVEPDTCININIDDTVPIILTDVVSDQNDENENENVYCKMNSLKCCCIIIILFIIGIILL